MVMSTSVVPQCKYTVYTVIWRVLYFADGNYMKECHFVIVFMKCILKMAKFKYENFVKAILSTHKNYVPQ